MWTQEHCEDSFSFMAAGPLTLDLVSGIARSALEEVSWFPVSEPETPPATGHTQVEHGTVSSPTLQQSSSPPPNQALLGLLQLRVRPVDKLAVSGVSLSHRVEGLSIPLSP